MMAKGEHEGTEDKRNEEAGADIKDTFQKAHSLERCDDHNE